MEWIRERYGTLGDAAGPRKYVIGLIFTAAVAGIDRIEEFARWAVSEWLEFPLQATEPTVIFGFPSWIVGLTVAFALLWWWTLEYAVRLRRRLRPGISITFEGKEPWVHPVPANTPSRDDPERIVRTQSIFVRYKVENTTPGTVVRGCEAFLSKVSKRNDSGEFIQVSSGDSLRLRWSAKPENISFGKISIPYGINVFCDLLSVDEEHNSVLVKWEVPLNINQGIFSEPAVYRFDVLAISENGGPVTSSIYLDWGGEWASIRTW